MNNEDQIPKVGEQRVVKISKKKFIWTVVVVIIVVLAFAGYKLVTNTVSIGQGGTLSSSSFPSISEEYSGAIRGNSMPPYRGGGQSDITDTREFLKVSYSGTVQTRNVSDVMGDAEAAVRNAGGRVDSISVNEKYGNLSFVVPKSEFYQFKDDIEKVVHRKLYTENISSQNLLGQKQNIERQEEVATKTLEELEREKAVLQSSHNKKVVALQSELATVQNQLAELASLIGQDLNDVTLDDETINDLLQQQAQLRSQETMIKREQLSENSSYTSQNNGLTNQIAVANGTLENVEQQDEDFGNNIETVSGNFNARWVSVWQMARLFLPIRPGWVIVIIVIIAFWWMRRSKKVPKIMFV